MPLEQAIEYALASPDCPPPTTGTPDEPSAGLQTVPLTRREHQIVALIARGLTNRQIAEELVIGERTVHTHVGHILRKLGLATRTQIAAWALEHGVVAERNS